MKDPKRYIVKSGIYGAGYDDINSALAMAERLTTKHKTVSIIYEAITKVELSAETQIKYTIIDTK